MKKILFGIGTLNVGGTEKHLIDILKGLDRKKFQISVFLLWQNGENIRLVPSDVRVYKVPKFLLKKSRLAVLFQSIRLIMILSTSKFSFVHFFLPHMYVVGGLISWFLKKRVIMSRRSLNNYQQKSNLFKKIELFLHRKCVKIFVNSKSIKSQLVELENVNEKKIELVYNGVENFNKKKKITSEVTIICIANFIDYKRHFDILRAFKEINDKKSKLMLVGNGSSLRIKELLSCAKNYNIDKRVDIVTNENKAHKLINKSDIGLLASEEEGFSNAILEYMSYGLPIVASNIGGNKEAVIHNKNGFLFEVGDYMKICYYLNKLIKNEKLRIKMGIESRLIQRSKFTIKNQINSYHKIYSTL